MSNIDGPKTCSVLLKEYQDRLKSLGVVRGKPLKLDISDEQAIRKITAPFSGVDRPHDVIAAEITFYNPTTIKPRSGKRRIALRVEPKSTEMNSHVMFFEELDDKWKLIYDAPQLAMQDPFHVEDVQGYNIFGGVETFPDKDKPGHLNYRTVFYKYKEDIHELDKPFAKGPDRMKDIRLIDLKNGKIGVFTRPQYGKFGLGKIGYTEIDNLDQLTAENIWNAQTIWGQFNKYEWGGANDLYLLKNGKIGVLGHIAHLRKNPSGNPKFLKNYYAMSFVFDPKVRKASPIKIIATAKDLGMELERKLNELGDVIFSGGLELIDHHAKLYAGVNDIHAVCFDIPNPFKDEM